MTKNLIKQKILAFFLHSFLSLIPISAFVFLIFNYWYPDVLFYIDGGWQGARLLTLVDVVLGPFLTFIVFNPRKPELKRDLFIIVFLQLICLFSGIYIIHSERPLAVAFSKGEFHTINRSGYEYFNVDPSYLHELPGPYPKQIYVTSPPQRKSMDFNKKLENLNIVPERFRTELVSALEDHRINIEKQGLSASQLAERHASENAQIESLWRNRRSDKAKFYKITGRYNSVYAIYDTKIQRFERQYFSPR